MASTFNRDIVMVDPTFDLGHGLGSSSTITENKPEVNYNDTSKTDNLSFTNPTSTVTNDFGKPENVSAYDQNKLVDEVNNDKVKQGYNTAKSNFKTDSKDILNDYLAEDKTKLDPNINKNLAKPAIDKALNNKDFNNTLMLSRLADKLNNKLWWHAKGPGFANITTGGGMSGTDPNASIGKAERYPEVETEEMRQMKANRAIDAASRARDVDRQADVRDLANYLYKLSATDREEILKRIASGDIDITNAMRQLSTTMTQQREMTRLGNIAAKYSLRLNEEHQNRIKDIVLNELNNNPITAQVIAGIYNPGLQTPTQLQMLESNLMSSIENSAINNGLTNEEVMAAVANAEYALAKIQFRALSNSFNEAITGKF